MDRVTFAARGVRAKEEIAMAEAVLIFGKNT